MTAFILPEFYVFVSQDKDGLGGREQTFVTTRKEALDELWQHDDLVMVLHMTQGPDEPITAGHYCDVSEDLVREWIDQVGAEEVTSQQAVFLGSIWSGAYDYIDECMAEVERSDRDEHSTHWGKP